MLAKNNEDNATGPARQQMNSKMEYRQNMTFTDPAKITCCKTACCFYKCGCERPDDLEHYNTVKSDEKTFCCLSFRAVGPNDKVKMEKGGITLLKKSHEFEKSSWTTRRRLTTA